MPTTHRFTKLPGWFALQEIPDGILHLWEPDYRDDFRRVLDTYLSSVPGEND